MYITLHTKKKKFSRYAAKSTIDSSRKYYNHEKSERDIKYKYTTDFPRTVALLLHNKTPNPMHLSSIKEGTQKKKPSKVNYGLKVKLAIIKSQ